MNERLEGREENAEAVGGGIDEWLEFSPGPERPQVRRTLHPLAIVAAVAGILIVVGLVALRPTGESRERAEQRLSALGVPTDFFRAEVTGVAVAPCAFTPEVDCVAATFTILSGPDAGRRYEQEFLAGGTTPDFRVGQVAVLSYREPNGRVDTVDLAPCGFDPGQTCAAITVVMTRGDVIGDRVIIEIPQDVTDHRIGDLIEVTFDEVGVAIAAVPVDIETQYQFSDFERGTVLLVVFFIFAAAVIALGRWRGVAALAGLGATLLIVMLWLLPALLDGRNAVWVALIGSAAVAYVALYVTHGFNLMSTTALIGTLAALALTTALSALTVIAAEFSGFISEEATLLTLFEGIDVRGLLLAGMVLGAAGALDDVTITQSSAVWQIKASNPDATRGELWRGGLRIGQHHIGSTVNTLLLAYLGAALPLTILFLLAQQSFGTVANSEVVAVEIVRTMVGSIGLVAAVPVTTWLASRVVP